MVCTGHCTWLGHAGQRISKVELVPEENHEQKTLAILYSVCTIAMCSGISGGLDLQSVRDCRYALANRLLDASICRRAFLKRCPLPFSTSSDSKNKDRRIPEVFDS